MKIDFDMTLRATDDNLKQFAAELMEIASQVDFKISARGWCYQMESERLIDKSEFDRVETLINKCRKKGILPVDFIAEEGRREFSGVEEPDTVSPEYHMGYYIQAVLESEKYYTPDWWDGEDYYIQMVVEKIDLKSLFSPVCKKYHIPIATSSGWSSMLQRAIYARRFAEAEDKGLKPVLLYCGDHDPDGLRISDFLRKNLMDIRNIRWEDGMRGYDPSDLIIKRFGLNADFIETHQLTWIDNLITGSKKNLASPSHKNFSMPYVQSYITRYGVRKCEANALVPKPVIARELVEQTILGFLGEDATERFKGKRDEVKLRCDRLRKETGVKEAMEKALNQVGWDTDSED